MESQRIVVALHILLLVGLFFGIRNGMQYLIFLRSWKILYYTLSTMQGLILIWLIVSFQSVVAETIKRYNESVFTGGSNWVPYYSFTSLMGFISGKKKLIDQRVKVVFGSDPYANLEMIREVRHSYRSWVKALDALSIITFIPTVVFGFFCVFLLLIICTSDITKIGLFPHPLLVFLIFWVQFSLKEDYAGSLLFSRIGKFRRRVSNEQLDEEVKQGRFKSLNLRLDSRTTFESKEDFEKFLITIGKPELLPKKRKRKMAKETTESQSEV